MLVEAVLRFLPQKNLSGGGPYAVDWILLSESDLSRLSPQAGAQYPIELPQDLASKILIHLRPPVETAEDPTDRALPLLQHVRLSLIEEVQQGDKRIIRIAGQMHLKKDPFPDPVDDHIRWEIVENYIEAEGFVEIDKTGAVKDIQLLTTKALFLPPHQKLITYDAVTHIYKAPKPPKL